MAAQWGRATTGAPLYAAVLAAAGGDPGWVPEAEADRADVSAGLAASALSPAFLYL